MTAEQEVDQAAQTTREMALAIADFAIIYNMALEPINPEFRDLSALRYGRKQVGSTARCTRYLR